MSAVFSVLVGLVALATIPVAVLAAERYDQLTLLQSSVAIAPAFLLSFAAISGGGGAAPPSGASTASAGTSSRWSAGSSATCRCTWR
jgi:hypothetical protein